MKRLKLLFSFLTISLLLIPSLNAQVTSSMGKPDSMMVIYGCMNPHAMNYNPLAQKDNGTCIFKDSIISNPVIFGCMDSTALNYNPNAKYSNHNCIYKIVVPGCTDSLALNFNKAANRNDGSCQYERKVWGCTDKNALNFNPLATQDNGKCIYKTVIPGCTDKTALNFNPMATQDNGKCVFAKDSTLIYGCTDHYALNYNRFAKIDNGSCKYVTKTDSIKGCMDSLALNFNPLATISNNHCIYVHKTDSAILGCRSRKALNYNPNATKDDGSCVFAHPGSIVLPAIKDLTTLKDTVNVLLQNACGFNYDLPIDTAYIKNIKPLGNHNFVVTWTIVQDTVKTHVATKFTVNKDSSLLILSLVCKQGPVATTGGPSKVISSTTATVNGITIASATPMSKIISGLNAVTSDYGVKLYPNPVHNQLNVSYTTTDNDAVQLNIYSIDGRRLMTSETIAVNGLNNFEMNTTNLTAGIHFLTVSRNGVVVNTIKFAKF